MSDGLAAVRRGPPLAITVMGLRDEIDSGHIMLSLMEEAQARSLYLFIQGREPRFKALLKRVLEAATQGDYRSNEEPDLTLDADKRRLFEFIRVANEFEGRRAAEGQRQQQQQDS